MCMVVDMSQTRLYTERASEMDGLCTVLSFKTPPLAYLCSLPQGFVDPHVHLIPAGLSLAQLNLAGVTSRAAFMNACRRACSGVAAGTWVHGGGWDEAAWGGQVPHRTWLDEVSASVRAVHTLTGDSTLTCTMQQSSTLTWP